MDDTEGHVSSNSNMSSSKQEVVYGILASIMEEESEEGDVALRIADSLRPYNMSLKPVEVKNRLKEFLNRSYRLGISNHRTPLMFQPSFYFCPTPYDTVLPQVHTPVIRQYEGHFSFFLVYSTRLFYPLVGALGSMGSLRVSSITFSFVLGLNSALLDLIKELVLPKILGHKHQPLSIVIPITIVYSIIFVTGVVGNFCTCLVIIRNKYMRTVTNYYLFNLSISDLLLLLMGLPMEIYLTWSQYPFPFGEAFCRFRFWASEVSSNVSVLTITAFTVERYMAICHPIRFPTHPGLSRPLRVMTAVWLLSSLWCIGLALQMGLSFKQWNQEKIEESARCEMLSPSVAITVFQVSSIIFFIIPMSLIALLYFFIALAIRRSTLIRAGSNSSNDCSHTHSNSDVRQNSTNQQHARIRQSVLKMLVAVVVAFFICWAPFHSQRLLSVYDGTSSKNMEAHNVVLYISGVTYYVSATVNPVLYSIMSLKFRQAFRATLLCCCSWARSRPKRRANRNSYTFKFHHRAAQANTHCSIVESSSSNTNNNVSNNNKQVANFTTPVLCCVVGNEAVSTQLEGRPLVGVVACESPRRHSYESNCYGPANNLPRML